MDRVTKLGYACAFVLSLSAVGCAGASSSHGDLKAEPAHKEVPVSITPHPALTQLSAEKGGGSIADVAEGALPSVVNISMTKLTKTQGNPFFPFGGGDDGERREQGMGSGVIVSADGYVLTNNHVVSDAQEIKVTTSDRRDFEATVVGTDPKSDLAVIKIKGASGLKAIEFGDASRLRLGDVVLAIGNPFGVGQTVTMGIVSAKGRADMGIVDYEDFIQTDAAINPGNSGGALINTEGKLVGVNTAILSRTGGYQGIGFAIPSNMAQPIMETLKTSGKVSRGWLGVAIQDVDHELASALSLASNAGVLLSEVKSGGPAAKAGLRRGDVVVKVDSTPITSAGQFRNQIASGGARHPVQLEVMRDGKPLALRVELGEMPGEERGVAGAPSPAASGGALQGVAVEDLNANIRRAFEIGSEVPRGVVITRVDRQSPAARAGLRPGDVVLEIDRQSADSLDKFRALYGKAKSKLLLLVNRHGSTQYVVVGK